MPDRFTIKRAGPEEADDIRALTRKAYAPWVDIVGREPLPMTADYDKAVREHLTVVEPGESELALVRCKGRLIDTVHPAGRAMYAKALFPVEVEMIDTGETLELPAHLIGPLARLDGLISFVSRSVITACILVLVRSPHAPPHCTAP